MPNRLAPLVTASALALTSTPALAQSQQPAAQATDPSEQAASFVQSYAAATKRQVIARWGQPICVRITGLADDEAAAVKARVEEVAKGVGVQVQPAGCKRASIEIGFAGDAQAMLDRVIKTDSRLLGDSTSGATPARTVTLPIQAWYLTNGADVAANDTGDLKALADYRGGDRAGLKTQILYQGCPPVGPVCPSGDISTGVPGGAAGAPGGFLYQQDWLTSHGLPGAGRSRARQFVNVLIIVDAKRIPYTNLGPLADYVAVLALSQPKSLDSCQALPSITDLFAACSGRASPESLTPADTAYLHALYADHGNRRIDGSAGSARVADVVKAMAPLLAAAKLAVR
jgi:hypothetical protein